MLSTRLTVLRLIRSCSLALLLFFCTSTQLQAVDGVIEINQARAITGAVTAGDVPGFPVTIATSGSYILTGNLSVTDTTTSAIEVTAEFVTINLNGFTIRGPVTCTGSGASLACSPTGTAYGVVGGNRVTLQNGSVVGFPGKGIVLQMDGRVENVTAMYNGAGGISMSPGRGAAVDNLVRYNMGVGINIGQNSVVRGNVCNDNSGTGIQGSGSGIQVVGNTTNRNGGGGMDIGGGVVSANTAESNGGNQIRTNGASLVTGNAVYGGPGSGWGIYLETTDGYSNNVVLTVGSSGTVRFGVNLGGNLCNGVITCP